MDQDKLNEIRARDICMDECKKKFDQMCEGKDIDLDFDLFITDFCKKCNAWEMFIDTLPKN